MSSKRSSQSKKADKIKEQAYRRLAKKKPEVLERKFQPVEEKKSTWPYILMMVLGMVILFIGSALENWYIVIAAMVISFYGTMRYSYITAKTKAAQAKEAQVRGPKVLGEEKLE